MNNSHPAVAAGVVACRSERSQAGRQGRLPLRLIGAAWIATLPFAAASERTQLAFPGAEGFGAKAIGGRGGRVIEVTHLDDSGPGSLRAALEAEGPRTIVFRVGGTIELMTELVLKHPFVTIAGQTAPGGGITLKNHPSNSRSALTIARGCHDVIIRHLRSRPGGYSLPPQRAAKSAESSEVQDALQILGSRHVIVDHCSFSWATDEVVSTFYDTQDVTIQWCIISEALVKSRPDQQLPGKGLLIGSKDGGNVSVHHNLMVHNVGRNPLIKCAGVVDVVNNVVLAPASVSMAIDATLAKPAAANFVGNHVTAPKADESQHGLAAIEQGTFALYVHDNLGPKRRGAGDPEEWFVNPRNNGRKWIVAERHAAPPITTHRAVEVLEPILAGAGCTQPQRDAVDLRIVDDVRQRITRLVNRPGDVGGWPELARGSPPADGDRDGMPDDWEKLHRFAGNNAADGNADPDGDGYTNLEEFLNSTNPHTKD